MYPGKIKYSFWDIRDKSRKENKGWRLDYGLVSKALMPCVVDSEIHNDYWGSDHCPISLTVNVDKIDLQEFCEYMSLGTGHSNYNTTNGKKDLASKYASNADALAALNEIKDRNGYLDEDRKSDLEDFMEDAMDRDLIGEQYVGMHDHHGEGDSNDDPFSEENCKKSAEERKR